MTKEDDLREMLDKTAEEFSRYSNNPSTWLAWIVSLLERLEDKATDTNPMHQQLYTDMLSILQDSVRNRLRTGGW